MTDDNPNDISKEQLEKITERIKELEGTPPEEFIDELMGMLPEHHQSAINSLSEMMQAMSMPAIHGFGEKWGTKLFGDDLEELEANPEVKEFVQDLFNFALTCNHAGLATGRQMIAIQKTLSEDPPPGEVVH
jgi:hypothetical protein